MVNAVSSFFICPVLINLRLNPNNRLQSDNECYIIAEYSI